MKGNVIAHYINEMKIFSNILNVVLSLLFLAYGILDAFDFFSTIPFLADKSGSLMLVAMSIFLFSHLIERNTQINKIEKATQDISDSMSLLTNGDIAEITCLNSPEELYNYLAQAVRTAKHSICDLTWGLTTPIIDTSIQQKAMTNYFSALLEAIDKNNLLYKEVMTFPDRRRLYRVDKIIQEGYKGYNLRYYNISPEEHRRIPPLLQFLVIDEKEVILHMHRGTALEPNNQPFISIKNASVVQYFVDYYNAIWSGATVLIDVTHCEKELIKELGAKLSQEEPVFKKVYNEAKRK